MKKITGPVTRSMVEALAADWANDPSTTTELVHHEFNADQHSGGYAFRCDRGLLVHGFDGGSVWSLDPGDDASRRAEIERYWRKSQHRNRVAPPREFRDDDAGYLVWLSEHPDGYVINVARNHGATAARVHRAGCRTISGRSPHGGGWTTGPYVKVCAQHLVELDRWAIDHVAKPVPPCGICQPASSAAPSPTSTATERTSTAPAATSPQLEGRHEIRGATPDGAIVEAWANDYLRFEGRPDWQDDLRTEIRSRCQRLEPSLGQVLHATFFGAKQPNADVENLALYNIGSFKVAGRNGIRFEHGAEVPLAPGGDDYRFCYRYALAPRSGAFAHWKQERRLASFDWTDLGGTQLAWVWLALARGDVEVFDKAGPDTPFAVKVRVRPPHGRPPVWGGLVKGIFDGVICAFHAHTDTAALPEVVARLAAVLPADSAELEEHLRDGRRAVLGARDRLVAPYRAGVKWDPADHLCVAGELLGAQPVGPRWAIKGELVEVSR